MKKSILALGLAGIVMSSSSFASVISSNEYRHADHSATTTLEAGISKYDGGDAAGLGRFGSDTGYFVKFKQEATGKVGVEADFDAFDAKLKGGAGDFDVRQYRVAANYRIDLTKHDLYVRPSLGLVYTDIESKHDTGVSAEVALGSDLLIDKTKLEVTLRYDDADHADLGDELYVGLSAEYAFNKQAYGTFKLEDNAFGGAASLGFGYKF